MNPEEITRNYKGSDVYLTETARTIQALLVSDLPKFTAFDTTITAAYAAQFLAAVAAAETVVADTAVIDQQVQRTELIFAAMEKAKAKYADVKYFAQKTFPNSPATQGELGLNDYDKARRSAPQMIQFLDEMSKACVKYQAQLVAKGFNAAAIAEIQTIRTELLNANSNQEVFKKQRPKMTEDRITTLNNCYAFVVQVNAAAQLVYKTTYAKQNQFVYNPTSATSTQVLSGVVPASTTVTVDTVPFLPENVFSFKNTGTTPLIFCLSTTTAVEGISVSLGGGATVIKSASGLNPNATQLVVQNTSATQEGSYEIEVDE